MFSFLKRSISNLDLVMLISVLPILLTGLITMKSFGMGTESLVLKTAPDYFMKRQIIWIFTGLAAFFITRSFDWKFLKRSSSPLIVAYLGINFLLGLLLILQNRIKGATSWINLGFFTFEPSDILKIIIILMLAKYFSVRHVEIANIKHIIISALYAGIPAVLVLLQPDFGSTAIIFLIWFGMVLSSGVNKKHLALVIISITAFFVLSWFFLLAPYQKLRISTFINPLLDPRGAGYNILQSKIAIGSGGLLGKGIGFGSQSRLNFLPEHETDFIFAAFAEEWGFLGVALIFGFFGIFLWRIFKYVFVEKLEKNNFEKLFAMGLSFLFFSQFAINVGMNLGMLPVTGLTLPFMSYGGSHIISSFIALGIFSSFSKK